MTDHSSPPPTESPAIRDIALCLSGGGYRAAIFHLGALRWLNEQGVLARLKMISAVSGGSIIAGHLAYRFRSGWPERPLDAADWNQRIVETFWQFAHRDIRTWPVLTRFLFPWNWFRSWTTVEALQREYEKHLFGNSAFLLTDIHPATEVIFCSTDMIFGINWEASPGHVGDYEAGHLSPPPTHWTAARAIAASSCFPPIFPPARTWIPAKDLPQGHYGGKDRDKRVDAIRLTDGGVYDNMGVQPAFYEKKLLVSDGGGRLDFVLLNLPLRRLTRYTSLLQNGVGKLRRSWLARDFTSKPPLKEGCVWGIHDEPRLGPLAAEDDIAALIATIRTDLNGFTRPEFEILQNQGYLFAADQTLTYAPRLLATPVPPQSVRPPYPHWEDAKAARRALRHSRNRFWPYRLR